MKRNVTIKKCGFVEAAKFFATRQDDEIVVVAKSNSSVNTEVSKSTGAVVYIPPDFDAMVRRLHPTAKASEYDVVLARVDQLLDAMVGQLQVMAAKTTQPG